MVDIGQIEYVNVRELWHYEAYDFTGFMARVNPAVGLALA